MQRIQNTLAADDHIIEIRIHAAAPLPRIVGVKRHKTRVAQNWLNHHFAEDPFEVRTFVFPGAVAEHLVPDMESEKMGHLMQGHTQRAALAVEIEHLKSMRLQETG